LRQPWQPDPLERLLNIPTVSKLTGLNRRTLAYWCKQGRLKDAEQFGGPRGSWYIPLRTLVELGLVAQVAQVAEVSNQSPTLED
jgi:hypothetical protein